MAKPEKVLEQTAEAPVWVEDIESIVPQPAPDDKVGRKARKEIFLFRHPDHGGGYALANRVPGKKQRPFNYGDKVAMYGLFYLIVGRRQIYLMKEVKTLKKITTVINNEAVTEEREVFEVAPYEPDPLMQNDISPAKCWYLTVWDSWRDYLMAGSSWREIIRVGLIILGIIGITVFFYIAWSNVRQTGIQAPPPASPEVYWEAFKNARI